MAYTIDDRRSDKTKPWGFVVFTDTFLSGWGKAPGRSFFALAVDESEADTVLANGRARSDMRDGRVVKDVFKMRLKPGDHLSIRDREDASRWYQPGGFGGS